MAFFISIIMKQIIGSMIGFGIFLGIPSSLAYLNYRASQNPDNVDIVEKNYFGWYDARLHGKIGERLHVIVEDDKGNRVIGIDLGGEGVVDRIELQGDIIPDLYNMASLDIMSKVEYALLEERFIND